MKPIALTLAFMLVACAATAIAQTDGEPVLDESNSVPLFDGKTLDGWVTEGGRYDGKAKWSVRDGTITGVVGPGNAGGLIYTKDYYANFVATMECKVGFPFDSGIFVRMVPRPGQKGAQVTIDNKPNGEIGGIYSDGWYHHNPSGMEKMKQGEWNRFTVLCEGHPMHISAWINGQKLVEYTFEKAEGFEPEGRIGVQVHGGGSEGEGQIVQYRNLRVRDLPDYDPRLFTCDDRGILSLTGKGKNSGWKPLFNGKDLEGWEPIGGSSESDYQVRDDMIVLPKAGAPNGHLRTKESFRDFDLRVDFNMAYSANSGLVLRGDAAHPEASPTYSGCEIQILDDFNYEKANNYKLKPWQHCGSLYAAQAPKVEALRPPGRWNTYEVSFRGSQLAVKLNGKLLYDVDTLKLEVIQGKPFAERVKEGFIALQRHAPKTVQSKDYLRFRNVFIRKR